MIYKVDNKNLHLYNPTLNTIHHVNPLILEIPVQKEMQTPPFIPPQGGNFVIHSISMIYKVDNKNLHLYNPTLNTIHHVNPLILEIPVQKEMP